MTVKLKREENPNRFSGRPLKLFEISVYSRSVEQYAKDWERQKSRKLEGLLSSVRSGGDEPSASLVKEWERSIQEQYWKPWQLNDIVGCIVVECHDGHVRCSMYSKKRRNSRYAEYNGKVGEAHVRARMTSIEMADELTSMVDNVVEYVKGSTASGRTWFFDREVFDRIVRSTDWRSVLLEDTEI